MRSFLSSLVLLVLLSPNFLRANDLRDGSKINDEYQSVYDVDANVTDENSVKVRWSWNEIVPQKFLIDFEKGDISEYAFDNEVSTYPWAITENAYEGSYAIKSTNQGKSNSTSTIEITVDVPYDGFVGFNYRISSEKEYDVARFYIDDVMMMETSGDRNWEYKEYEITEGTHTYRWEYVKDVSYEEEEDTFYLDNIKLYGELEPYEGGWIHYDDGECVGSTGAFGAPVYWAILFPKTETYAGLTLTKVAIYDYSNSNAGTHTANIYLGGTDAPGTLVSSASAELTGADEMVEIELDTPVELDGTEPLWISFYATGIHAPATVCTYVDDPNSDWYSSDGVTWTHAHELLPNSKYSWMIRGYVEDAKGRTILLENEKPESKEIQFNSFKLYRYDYFAGEISAETVDVVATDITDTLYYDNAWTSLEDGMYQWGVAVVYDEVKQGVKNYSFQNDNESAIVWSNTVDKNMLTNVNVEVTTDNNASPEGTTVKLINKSEPGLGYDYEIVLDETGTYSWDKFRKGTYSLTITKPGYESCADNETMEIWAETTIDCELNEMTSPVELYVSPTAWAMWTIEGDNALSYEVYLNEILEEEVTTTYYQHENVTEGQSYTTKVIANYYTGSSIPATYTWTYEGCDDFEGVTEFTAKYANGRAVLNWLTPGMEALQPQTLSYSFENNLEGWTTIDANGDDHVWYHDSECESNHGVEGVESHTGYGHLCSESFCNGEGTALFPDDYLVAPEKIVVTATSKISFWASAQDAVYAGEHFGVAVSTDGNTSVNDFTTIAEWTLIAKSSNAKSQRGTTAQGTWYQYEVDLSSYEGQEIWVALRHFDVTDMFILLIDDVELVDVVPLFAKADESLVIGAMVYRDGELVTSEPITTGRFTEPMEILAQREYCVRVVYGGELDETYYAMSNPDCITVNAQVTCYTPEDLYGIQSANDYGDLGVRLVWPYSEPTTNWLRYDNGIKVDAIGAQGTFYWGVMFPSESLIGYQGTKLTKVALYDVVPSTGTFSIYTGGYDAPGTMIHNQSYSTSGSEEIIEINLTSPLPIDITKNLWVVFDTNQGELYPAAVSTNCGDPNSRWISMDGTTWEDMLDYGLNYTWMLRAYVSDDAKNTRALDHYNVYRGNSSDDFEFIAETTKGTYFDKVDEGIYYYQVTAVYVEEGESCESEPANAYGIEGQDYVMVVVKTESVNENALDNMSIYPNPTKNVLNIEAEAMLRIIITNTLGQVVCDQETDGDKEVIDMSQYETGVYMIRVTTENGTSVRRVTVVK